VVSITNGEEKAKKLEGNYREIVIYLIGYLLSTAEMLISELLHQLQLPINFMKLRARLISK